MCSKRGSILGAIYAAKWVNFRRKSTQIELEHDVHVLLKVYSDLWEKFPNSLVDAETYLSTEDFNITVEEKIKTVTKVPATAGPQDRPATSKLSGRETYVRSASVTSRAIAMANFVCALSHDGKYHPSFVWKKTGTNYVEAHHLIPFSKQNKFSNSLDVEENIVVLCANCHRLLHHARSDEKRESLKSLWKDRKDKLAERGLAIELSQLIKLYGDLTNED